VAVEIADTRYAKSGDVHIAFQVVGQGSVDLVHVPGFASNVEEVWEGSHARRFLERLASFSRLILLDKRGTGLSDPVAIADLRTLAAPPPPSEPLASWASRYERGCIRARSSWPGRPCGASPCTSAHALPDSPARARYSSRAR
jgi:pimeloyl-ACP methyl ester carboxylesterase